MNKKFHSWFCILHMFVRDKRRIYPLLVLHKLHQKQPRRNARKKGRRLKLVELNTYVHARNVMIDENRSKSPLDDLAERVSKAGRILVVRLVKKYVLVVKLVNKYTALCV
nr:hypothetical protein [Tanacetum cinerariifolium]